MKLTISDVLQHLIQEKGLTVSELARRVNIPQPTIQRIASGAHSRPHSKTLEVLAKYFSVSTDQLRGMEPIEGFHISQSNIVSRIPVLETTEITAALNEHKVEIDKSDREYIVVDKTIGDTAYALKMPDPSMEPLIPKGSILIVDPNKGPAYRSFVIVKYSTCKNAVVRQLIKDADHLYTRPLSFDLEQLNLKLLSKEDMILGVVVEVRMSYK